MEKNTYVGITLIRVFFMLMAYRGKLLMKICFSYNSLVGYSDSVICLGDSVGSMSVRIAQDPGLNPGPDETLLKLAM